MSSSKVLVVDDEKLIRWSLQQNLEKEGFAVLLAGNGKQGLELYHEEQPDIVLLDMQLPDISGLTLLEDIRKCNRNAVVIMITAYGDVRTAVKAIKSGAYDFVEKPFDQDKLRIMISKAAETAALRREVSHFRARLSGRYGFANIVGKSAPMLRVLELARKVAQSDASTVLLQGESGTGKDLIAKAIHYESRRAEKPFMDINCTALPETLIASELFGHERGAFTDAKNAKKGLFELADGGTVFLDEIADMKPSTQVQLLKVIENKTFKRVGGVKDISTDVRIIAATNKNLLGEVKRGNFREDLFYRLNVIPIYLPPLRERRDDITLLAGHFIDVFNREFKKNVKSLSREAEDWFISYPWPGNVRELRNIIERAMILENEQYILPDHLPVELSSDSNAADIGNLEHVKLPDGGLDIEKVERELIRQALDQTGRNQTKAARLLNLTRDALRYRMQKFGFSADKNGREKMGKKGHEGTNRR